MSFLKNFALVAGLFFAGSALASEPLVPMTDEDGLKSERCQVVFLIENVVFLNTIVAANNFCNGIYRNHGFESGCFIRDHGNNFNNQFEINFNHRGGFFGDNFRGANNAYNNFIGQRRLYQNDFQFRSQYFNCID